MGTPVSRPIILVATLAAWLAAAPTSGQYFGRNKVQYKHLDYLVLKTEHFDIYSYAEGRAGVDISARLAERWYARLSRIFHHSLRGRQPLVLYASHPDFEQTNVIQDELSEGTGGVTEPIRRRIVLPLGGPLADTDHVIGHELVHAFQFDLTTKVTDAPGASGVNRLPLWFVEGLAEYLSIGPVDATTAMWLRDAMQHEKLPSIDQLDDPEYFPYRWGQAFWAYVCGRWGDPVIRQLLVIAAAGGNVEVALEKVLRVKGPELSSEWHTAIRRAYEPVLASARLPESGRLLIKGTTFGADLNVGPAISPDGRWIAFLSSRSFFSIDVYVADAVSGQVVRKLTSTATDPHYASLQFIFSAGAWDSTSRRLAVATVVAGRPVLAIFDAETGRTERELPIPAVDEIFNPTWAPDGQAIGFTGMAQGLTDLYIYDLKTSTLRRLTNDPYADLQPAWSPDGRRIAFATDRFSTDLPSLAIGGHRLAIIDVESGRIAPLPALMDVTAFNPQWSPDGTELYFLAYRDGIPNIFRLTLATGLVAQLTSLATGISGITSWSPAMSVASRTGMTSFSVYDSGAYNIYVVNAWAGSAIRATPLVNAAVLPPSDRRPSDVAALLASPTVGLPEPVSYPATDYVPTLSLEGVGQPVIAVGASRFGAAFGGGLSLSFGDMLGNHRLATAVQFSSALANNFSSKDIAAQVGYFNQTHRWTWGLVAGQAPYLSGGFQVSQGTTSQGEPTQIEQTFINRQTERSTAGIVAYPFNRTQRVEMSGGVTQISFDQIVQTTAYSLYTGHLLANDTTETSPTRSLTLGTSSVAFVADTASFGATSPVQGQRYRIEAAPTFGTVNFTSFVGDYRRYFMPRSFYTIAVRALHYGRYGSGGEDPRLYPLYVGYPTLVRGYDVNTFDVRDCVPTATSQCPAFDRLLGSRLIVGNLEIRFPLMRPFGASRRMYGPLPVEVALFADGGTAWKSGEWPSLLGGSREGVSSTGVTFRVNLAGYAVGQFDMVRPLQRPGRGWIFQFNLTPGF
jgi:hypothetical protein